MEDHLEIIKSSKPEIEVNTTLIDQLMDETQQGFEIKFPQQKKEGGSFVEYEADELMPIPFKYRPIVESFGVDRIDTYYESMANSGRLYDQMGIERVDLGIKDKRFRERTLVLSNSSQKGEGLVREVTYTKVEDKHDGNNYYNQSIKVSLNGEDASAEFYGPETYLKDNFWNKPKGYLDAVFVLDRNGNRELVDYQIGRFDEAKVVIDGNEEIVRYQRLLSKLSDTQISDDNPFGTTYWEEYQMKDSGIKARINFSIRGDISNPTEIVVAIGSGLLKKPSNIVLFQDNSKGIKIILDKDCEDDLALLRQDEIFQFLQDGNINNTSRSELLAIISQKMQELESTFLTPQNVFAAQPALAKPNPS